MTVKRVKPLFSLQIPDQNVVRYPAQLVGKPKAAARPIKVEVMGGGRLRRHTSERGNVVLPSLSPLKLSSPKHNSGSTLLPSCSSPIAKVLGPMASRRLAAPAHHMQLRNSPLRHRPTGKAPAAVRLAPKNQVPPSTSAVFKAPPPHRLAPLHPRLSEGIVAHPRIGEISSSGLLTGAVPRKPRVKSASTAQGRPVPMARQTTAPSLYYCYS